MPRYSRNQAILFKIEAAVGTDAAPAPGADAVLVSNLQIKPFDAKYVNRNLAYPYFGASDDIPVYGYVSGSFDVELAGSGAAGTAPMWGRILRAAAFAEVITATTRVDYTPVSTGMESATIYYYDDGVLKKALGCRCSVKGSLKYGEIPKLSVSFMGTDGGDTAAANPASVFTAWKTPLPINQANTAQVNLGGAYAAGAVTGGQAAVTQGLEFDLGGEIKFTELVGGEAIDFTDRNVTGKITLDLTAAQEISNIASVKAITKQSISMLHGTTAGGKLLLFLPSCQLKAPSKADANGRRLIAYDFMAIPQSGNDELRIVVM